MLFWLGAAAFALTILVSVSLHELGHMITGKRFGMMVTQYFVGFGPTIFSFKRGETEYGLKAIPLGGFCKIVGMTPQDDDVAPEDQPRAMWRYPLWKRTVVMSAGSATHFLLGFAVLWITLVLVGVPNPAAFDIAKQPATISVAQCVFANEDSTTCTPGTDPASPARLGGLRDGDVITGLGDKPIRTYDDLQKAIRSSTLGPVDVTYQRNGQTEHTTVSLIPASRRPLAEQDNPNAKPVTVPALGVIYKIPPGVPTTITYGPGRALKESGLYTGRVFAAMGGAIGRIPQKVPALWNSLSGKPRDPNTPISVVGASRLGGETVQHGAWWLFLNILISLNFFVGVFNLLPLLPLDGGHIAIAWFERIRSWLYARLRRPDPGRVNYLRLMPFTYAVILIFGGFTVLTVAADIVNPITLFGK
jgi:membrane-associated protease RseP (regulator of RpoE activity)